MERNAPAPYTSGFVEADGRKLHYQDYGTAGRPAMVCLHGGGANAHWYDFVAPAFTPDYHVYALDLRGHGDSEWAGPRDYTYENYASDLNEVVEKLDIRDFVLIGHSMAGAACLVYATTYPGRMKSLILVDSTVNLSPERLAALRDVGSRGTRTYATREELVSRYRLRPGSSNATPEVLRHIAENSIRQQADGTWTHKFDRSVYGTRQPFNGMPLWKKISVPALLVKGANSQRMSPEIFAEVKSMCPQAELVEVARSDHHVTLDNPSGFEDAVKPFLAKNR